MTKALEKMGKTSLIKGTQDMIKEGKKGKGKERKATMSPDAQRAMNEAHKMIEGVDLNKGTYEQVKAIAEYVKEIYTKGKADKKVTDKALAAEKSIVQGTAAESLYKDVKPTELKNAEEITKFLEEKGGVEKFVIVDGKMLTKSSFKEFIKDNPDVNLKGSKGYEAVDVGEIRDYEKSLRGSQSVFTKNYWKNKLIKIKQASSVKELTSSIRNIETQFTRLKKGESPEFKKQIEEVLDQITEEADLAVEEAREKYEAKERDIYHQVFKGKNAKASVVKGNKRLKEAAPTKLKNKKGDKIAPISNGIAIDLYNVDMVNRRKAAELRAEAKKATNAATKKRKEAQAKALEEVVDNSGINSKELRDYIESNKDLKDFADKALEFFKEIGVDFEALSEEVTGKPYLNPHYYPMYREGISPGEVVAEPTIDSRARGEGEFAQRSAMSDRLKPADPLNTKNVQINVDVRTKMKEYYESMIHAEQYIPISKRVNQIFNKYTKGKILEKVGEKEYINMMDNLDAIIDANYNRKVRQEMGAFDKGLDWLNRFGIVLNLAAKPANLIKQLTSATHWGYAGLKDGITTAEVWAAGAEIPFSKEYSKVAYDIITSPFVRNRIRKSDIDPLLKNEILDLKNQPIGKAMYRAQQILMSPIIGGDIGGVLGGGVPYAVAKYKQVKTTPKGEFDPVAFRESYKRFRKEASTAQQSGKAFTTGKGQRKDLTKYLMTYKTSQTQAWNKMTQGWIEMTDKTNSPEARRKGFFQWQKFMRASLGFQAVGTGFAYSLIAGAASEEDKTEQQLFETVIGTLEGLFQGMGPVGYIPMAVTNYTMGRPTDWNLPPVMSTITGLTEDLIQIIALSFDKDWEDLSDYEKRSFTKLWHQVKDIAEKSTELDSFLKMMLGGKDKNYRNPLYETLIKGEDFKTTRYIKIPVKEKKEKETADPGYKLRPKPPKKGYKDRPTR